MRTLTYDCTCIATLHYNRTPISFQLVICRYRVVYKRTDMDVYYRNFKNYADRTSPMVIKNDLFTKRE